MNFDNLQNIEPIPQDDGPEAVCAIAYSPKFVQAFDYLRAILKADETSERAFDLTTVCLQLNPANYTVWHFRRRCLVAMSGAGSALSDPTIDVERIEKDLDFADKLGGTNPKNYQLWYHRRALLEFRFKGESEEALQVAKLELQYVDKILDDDSKNYHAWSHRQWIIRTVNSPQLWSSEIDYAHSKVTSDPRNNSAWNQRWFALHKGHPMVYLVDRTAALTLKKAEEEANYALSGAAVDPFNESPWSYLTGVLMEQWRLATRGGDANDIAKITDLIRDGIAQIREMKQSWEAQPPCEDRPSGVNCSLLSALVGLLEIFIEDKDVLMEAKALSGELVFEDPVRRKYWRKRENKISAMLEKL